MKEHIKRRIEYSKDALPEKDTPEYKSAIKKIEEFERVNPGFKKENKRRFKKAYKTWRLQEANGIGLNLDQEIRHYLVEFNHRSWSYGHRKMPIMFNIMEAFFTLDKSLNYWRLLDEENFSISFFDFIDFYTSENFESNMIDIENSLEEDLIYNFNVGSDLKEITFKTEDGKEFVIAGISLIRRGNEVTMFFVTGQVEDTKILSEKLAPLKSKELAVGKEELEVSDNRIREAVKLNEDPNLWKVMIACRFDLDSDTIEARHVAKDQGNSFQILTDDLTGFIFNGEWRDERQKETFNNLVKEINGYSSIFELAKACLFLPQYFDFYDDDIIEEEFETRLKTILKSPFKNKEFRIVDDRFKIRNRVLWILDRKKKFLSDRIILKDEKFKIETSGYWKKLQENEFGTDKKGNPIEGKTWVNKTESYYLAEERDLIIEKNTSVNFTEKNAGFIYIMRNGHLGKDFYKIGLTTKTTDERAKQLSKTSIPDRFFVMREWKVKDCYLAEKRIHKLLKLYRVDNRREFFKIDMKDANVVIDSVIDDINKN